MKTLAATIGACLLLTSCGLRAPAAVAPRARSAEAGLVHLYLQPLPQEAERLSFELAGISAVGVDGATRPLDLSLDTIGGGGPQRERLLAAGELAPGRYAGLQVSVSAASLRGEAGEALLGLPEEPARVDIPFVISRGRAVVLAVRFSFRESMARGHLFSPSFSAAAPDAIATGLIACAASRGSDLVTIFDKSSGRVAAVVPTGRGPAGLALDESRRRAYVALAGEDAIEVIDLQQQRVIDRLLLTAGDSPVELALTPDGRLLLSANAGSNTVSLIDAAMLVERNKIVVGNRPSSILVDRAGSRALVFNTLSDSIAVLALPSGSSAGEIGTDSAPYRGALNREEDRLYVIHESSPYMSVIDIAARSNLRRVYVGPGAAALKVDPRTGRIYVGRRGGGGVDVYDPFSLLPLETIPTEAGVAQMAIDQDSRSLYLVLPEPRQARRVGLVSKRTVSQTDLGADPFWVVFMGER